MLIAINFIVTTVETTPSDPVRTTATTKGTINIWTTDSHSTRWSSTFDSTTEPSEIDSTSDWVEVQSSTAAHEKGTTLTTTLPEGETSPIANGTDPTIALGERGINPTEETHMIAALTETDATPDQNDKVNVTEPEVPSTSLVTPAWDKSDGDDIPGELLL